MSDPPHAPPAETATTTKARVAKLTAAGQQRAAQGKAALEQARRDHDSVDFVWEVADHDKRTGGGLLAGALAFRLFLWVLPASLVVVGALGFATPRATSRLANKTGLGAYTVNAVEKASQQAHQGRWWLLILGSYLLYSASASLAKTVVGVTALEWQMPIPKMARLRAAAAVVSILGLVAAVWLASNWLRARSSTLGLGVSVTLLVVWIGVGWLLALRLPHPADATAFELLPGAVALGFGMQVLRLITTYYLSRKVQTSSELYGDLGGAATLLLWAYLLARLLVASAGVNRIFHTRRHGATTVFLPDGRATGESG